MTEPLAPWLEPLRVRVMGLAAHGRLPHALLFSGPGGWGEGVLAERVAADLLEVDDVRDLAHPDFRWVGPDGRLIKVEQVRELNDFVVGTPQMGGLKVVLVDDAHTMNENAANALLKTLEEPPAGTHLVLVCTRLGRLPATILSRCHRVPIRSRGESSMQSWLVDQGVPDDVARGHLLELGGAPYAALASWTDGEALLTPALMAGDPSALTRVVAEQAPERVVARWQRCVHGVLTGAIVLPRTPAARQLFRFADELRWVQAQLTTAGVNAPLLMERVLIQWSAVAGLRPAATG